MKLLRLAVLAFDQALEEDWRAWSIETDGVAVETLGARELEDDGLHLFVVAKVSLSERPTLNEDRLVVVPEGPLKEAEAAIEASANLIAVSERCKRSVTSTIPGVAFLPEDQESREWLDSTNGILRSPSGILSMGGFRIDQDTVVKLASDRLDGAALMAEALAHTHPTGVFHELVRLFERAFGLGPYALVQPLAEFLAGADSMGYTTAEVERWLLELRHPATHADRRLEFVLESDTRRVISRMMQAAYDVLFNKDSWRTSSTARREVWRPPAGTGGESNQLFVVQGNPARVEFQNFDETGSYPASLNAVVWDRMPPEWWSKWPSGEEDDASQ